MFTSNGGEDIYLVKLHNQPVVISLGIKNIKSSDEYVVYPNPLSSQSFSILTKNKHYQNCLVQIRDPFGRMVLSKNFALNGDQIINISMPYNQSGIYYLSVNFEKEYRNFYQKIIVP
jgi:hypothetical protein